MVERYATAAVKLAERKSIERGDELMTQPEIDEWDSAVTKLVKSAAEPFVTWWFRPEVRGLDRIPRGRGALIVANQTGGMMTPDVWVFARAFYDHFGFGFPPTYPRDDSRPRRPAPLAG